MGTAVLDSTGIAEGSLYGDGQHDDEGRPLHANGQGPHVVFDDGRHEWVRGWLTADGELVSLVESPQGWLYYRSLDGQEIPDDSVAFESEGDPTDSKMEYFSERALAEGWSRPDWEALSAGWPTWEYDLRRLGSEGAIATIS